MADEPATLDGDFSLLDADALRLAHRELIVEYATVLGKSARIGQPSTVAIKETFFSPESDAYSETNRQALQDEAGAGPNVDYLLRLLVEGHIRQKLRALSSRCAQLEATLDPSNEREMRDWLARVREDSERVASSLASLRLPRIIALLPFITTVAALVGKSSDIQRGVLSGLAGLGLVVGFYLYRNIRRAYRLKRELFLPGATELDREKLLPQVEYEGRNIYRSEDELFLLLGTGKRREVQLDDLAVALIFLSLIAFGVGSVLFYDSLIVMGVGLLVAVLAVVAWLFFEGSRTLHRIWR